MEGELGASFDPSTEPVGIVVDEGELASLDSGRSLGGRSRECSADSAVVTPSAADLLELLLIFGGRAQRY